MRNESPTATLSCPQAADRFPLSTLVPPQVKLEECTREECSPGH